MDQTGVLCSAASFAYFTMGKQVPLGTGHPLVIVTALGCYAMPRLYGGVLMNIDSSNKSGLMSGTAAQVGSVVAAVGASYLVARYMNV